MSSSFASDEDLLDLPLEEALTQRWEQGMAEYRQPDEPFVGDPVVELHNEGLDALNYVAVIEKNGADFDIIHELRRCALEIVWGARLLSGDRTEDDENYA